jgi:hypothetical protein
MNTLSWLIYFAGISESLIILFTILGILLTIGSLFMMMVSADPETKSDEKFNKPIRWTLISGITFLVLLVFVPNQKTIMLIATSEIGEKVVKSEQVANIADPSIALLKAWIEKQTKELNK